MSTNKAQYFELNYHRHGEKEWKIVTKTQTLYTNIVIVRVTVATAFRGNEAYILGTINYSKSATVIS